MTEALLLSFVECFASYLDVEGAKARFLLIKETSVGLGAGLTVFLSRELPSSLSGVSIGLLGVTAILVAAILLYKDRQNTLANERLMLKVSGVAS